MKGLDIYVEFAESLRVSQAGRAKEVSAEATKYGSIGIVGIRLWKVVTVLVMACSLVSGSALVHSAVAVE